MDSKRAFTLRDDLDAELFGGSVTLSDGTSYDVAEALRDGGGRIVTDDPGLIVALDAYTALIGSGAYDDATVPELRGEIERRNAERPDANAIEVAPPGNRAELLAALQSDDANPGQANVAPDAPGDDNDNDNDEGN